MICLDECYIQRPFSFPRLSYATIGHSDAANQERVTLPSQYLISLHQPDLVLGQALMLKARHHCDTVLITLPFTTGIYPGIENTLHHAGLAMVSVDHLEAAIGKGSKSAAKREEKSATVLDRQAID